MQELTQVCVWKMIYFGGLSDNMIYWNNVVC